MNLLRALLDMLAPERDTHAFVRAAQEDALISLLCPMHLTVQNLECVSLLPFRDPLVRACIHEAKYHDNRKAIELLAGVLQDYLLTLQEDIPFDDRPIMLVPVPLAHPRMKERGYNQVERVVRAATMHLAGEFVVTTESLSRVRNTASQTALSRDKRLANMIGAFSLSQDFPSRGTVVLIDDVVTTGATLSSAASVFARYPGRTVKTVALAH